MRRIVFLYTELAEYFMASIEALALRKTEIHIVRWPVNSEAPFKFRSLSDVKLYDRTDYTDQQLLELVSNLNPHLLVVSGWVDKGYLKVCRNMKGKSLNVLALDNHWLGTPRQWLAVASAKLWIKKHFDQAWVPGEPQSRYARKLGFAQNEITLGFYCADTKLFARHFAQHKDHIGKLPKRFIYIGRYVEFKGIHELWEAFSAFRQKHPEWELICIGTGELFVERATAAGIRHEGFVQPVDLPAYLLEAQAFVLPSHREPWGVVVHEMAAAGFPLICSDAVGAASAFLEAGKNGFRFEAGNKDELQLCMEQFAGLTNVERAMMAEHSHKLACRLTPEVWADRLMHFPIPSYHANQSS